jgi:putative sterol carrier protein
MNARASTVLRPVFPSEEWVGAWLALANRSAEFEASGKEWEGAVTLVIGAEPSAGLPSSIYIRLEGRHGKWLGHELSTDGRLAEGSVFVLRAPYARWKQVIRQELNPIKGLVQGKLRIHGHLPVIFKWTRSVLLLAELAGRLDTEFPDERVGPDGA